MFVIPTSSPSGGIQTPMTTTSGGVPTPPTPTQSNTIAAKGPDTSPASPGDSSIWALDDLSQAPFALLVVLSLLAPDCIQPDFFFSDMERGKLFVVDVEDYPQILNDYYDARSKLLECCLVRYVRTPDCDGSLRVHRIVQDAVILRCQDCFDFPSAFHSVSRMVSRL